MLTKFEREKQSMVLAAEGRLEIYQRNAVAQLTLAEASACSIRCAGCSAGSNKEDPAVERTQSPAACSHM
jgi:hypothetical protein